MGELLKRVKNTEKGLVGITHDGEEVLLSDKLIQHCCSGSEKEYHLLLNAAGEDGYVQFGGEVQRSLTKIPLIMGNIYRKRKI